MNSHQIGNGLFFAGGLMAAGVAGSILDRYAFLPDREPRVALYRQMENELVTLKNERKDISFYIDEKDIERVDELRFQISGVESNMQDMINNHPEIASYITRKKRELLFGIGAVVLSPIGLRMSSSKRGGESIV
jgi:hypothetical protein